MKNMLIKLSDDFIIACPIERFALVKVTRCLSCNFYNGISQAVVNGHPIEGNEADIYQIVCGKPITRRIQKVIK